MIKLFNYTLIIGLIFIFSCTSEEKTDEEVVKTELEGIWLRGNLSTGTKIEFSGNNFTVHLANGKIAGTFKLEGANFEGILKESYSMQYNEFDPSEFSVNYVKNTDKITFSDCLQIKWKEVFDGEYVKQ